ncbi:hypothetical protein ACWC9T_23510 [Kitasatospora sp. NPDC001159]
MTSRPPWHSVLGGTVHRPFAATAHSGSSALTVTPANADFSWGISNIRHPGLLPPGDVVLMHWTDTLATDLPRALAAADAAGVKPAGLVDPLH